MAEKGEDEQAPTRRIDRERDPARQVGLMVITRAGVTLLPLPAHGELEIGRSSSAALRIDDDSLSRRHAILRIVATDRGRSMWIEDLGSANGTLLRGTRLQANQPAVLEEGDAIELGSVLAIVQYVPEAAAPPTATLHDDLIARVADSDLSVLILGETGVGKEVLAERLHRASRRADRPLVKINCAALTSTLLESELFGHERGAFTGAVDKKVGLIEAADRGTFFLDEIGEMPVEAQAKLLRVLEAGEVHAVGALRPNRVDVRYLAATHRDPIEAIQSGQLRADLYYRLAGITLTIPPLRERRDEILTLAQKFVEANAKRTGRGSVSLTAQAMSALLEYSWPGNIRELRNVIERAVVVAPGSAVTPEHLELRAPPTAASDDERRHILDALAACGGNQTAAAERLGMSRRSLVYKLNAWGLTKPRRQRP